MGTGWSRTVSADLRKKLDALMATDLSSFNKMLKDKNINTVISGGQ